MAEIFKPVYFVDANGKRCKASDPGAIRKQSPCWWIRFYDPEMRRHKRRGFKDRAATQALAVELEKQAARQAAGLTDHFEVNAKKLLADHLCDFEQSLIHKRVTRQHIHETMHAIRDAAEKCRWIKLLEITGAKLQGYLNDLRERGLSLRTLNKRLVAVKRFIHWLLKEQRIQGNPIAHLNGFNAKLDARHERRALSIAEARALIESTQQSQAKRLGLSGPDRAMLYAVALGTGLRRNELASLTRESFDLQADQPTVIVENAYTKNRKRVEQPLPAWLVAMLHPWLTHKRAGERLWPGRLGKTSEVLAKDAHEARQNCIKRYGSIEDDFLAVVDSEGQRIDFHGLRHSYVTWLVQSGVNPKTAQALARHSTITLTMDRYCHVALRDLSGAVEQLPSLEAKPAIDQAKATGTMGKEPNSLGPYLGPNRLSECNLLRQNDTTVQNEQNSIKASENPEKDGESQRFLQVPKEGLEPTHPCGYRILNPTRLPFRHFGLSSFHSKFPGESWPGAAPESPASLGRCSVASGSVSVSR